MPTTADRHSGFAAHFGHLIDATTEWSALSPVPEWQALDVVEHLLGWLPHVLHAWVGLDLPDDPETDLSSRWRTRTDHVQALLESDTAQTRLRDGPMAGQPLGETLDRIYIPDIYMHSWDLARANGLDPGLDPTYAAGMLSGMRQMESVLRESGQYGPAHPTLSTDPVEQLMAFIGRDPTWAPLTAGSLPPD